MIDRRLIPLGLVLLGAAPAAAKDIALTFDSPPAKDIAGQVATRDPGPLNPPSLGDFDSGLSRPNTSSRAVSLSFTPKPEQTTKSAAPILEGVLHTLEALFQGGHNSLVARAVGSAEGTRTPEVAIPPLTMAMWTPVTANGTWVAFPISTGRSPPPRRMQNS